ncbi:hypothetical protein AGR8A_Lc20205 [Agrobacterium fabrum str. J-07]|nr:hypothetical protein AGR8A_Lc20205 [Agrobacterium fabrum str. J-07]
MPDKTLSDHLCEWDCDFLFLESKY